MIELVSEKMKDRIEELFMEAKTSIHIISPFLSSRTADMLCEVVDNNPNIECVFITRIYIKDLLDNVNNVDSLEKLIKHGINVYALQGLHAKMYIFDNAKAIIGSANFTLGGLERNFEISVYSDETSIVNEATLIFDDLAQYCVEKDGVVDLELMAEVRSKYEEAYKDRQKDFGKSSLSMFGAERKSKGVSIKGSDWRVSDLKIEDKDLVFDILEGKRKKTNNFNHNIWAKFEGKSDDRQPGNELPSLTKVFLDDKERYIVNFRNRPNGIQDGDQVYIVALTEDNNGKPTTRIVGRGFAKAYHNRNRVKPEWVKEHYWMSYYCYFCELTDVELINCIRSDCIPLDQVYSVLDKRTYVSTIDKDEVKNMSLCQCRRSHIQMTLDAKEYLDSELDKLFEKYGCIKL